MSLNSSSNDDDLPLHPLTHPKWGVELWRKTLFNHSHIPDYTFEERYVRGTPRPVYPERDEVCL